MKLTIVYQETISAQKEVEIKVLKKDILEHLGISSKEFNEDKEGYINSYLSDNLESFLENISEKDIVTLSEDIQEIEFLEYYD